MIKKNPKIILPESHTPYSGIKVMRNFFIGEKGFDFESLRVLIIRNPSLLSKTVEDFKTFFQVLSNQGLTQDEINAALLDCPILLNKKDLAGKIKEV